MGIKENIKHIKNKISKLKKEYNIERDISIMAATKTRNVREIQEAVDSGVEYIGENRIQEAMDKFHQLNRDVNKHFIGHLQLNKVKYAVRMFDCIQSVDRKELIDEIIKRLPGDKEYFDIFIEVNISGEKSKHGLSEDEVEKLVKYILKKDKIVLKGLMTMFPYGADKNYLVKKAKEMKNLFDNLKKYNEKKNVNLKHLSMGMSNDYEIAIEEGSNMVRLGSAIFGERSY
jgi:hypothetical protein